LEAHHHPIERPFAEMIDWSPTSQIRKNFPMFGWGSFDEVIKFIRLQARFVDKMADLVVFS
jgi:hypothetical protein